MKTHTHFLTVSSFIAMLAFSIGSGKANEIIFDDLNRASSSGLQIGGVTISGFLDGSAPAPVSTAAGHGLGLDGGLGATYEVNDNITWFPTAPGDFAGYLDQREGRITLTVAGIINSVSILPFARIYSASGQLLSITPEFQMDIDWGSAVDGGPPYRTVDPTSGGTQTFSPYPLAVGGPEASTVNLSMSHDFPPEFWLPSTVLPQGGIGEFGFSIVSIDYTPNASVPDPSSTSALLGISLTALVVVGRRFKPVSVSARVN